MLKDEYCRKFFPSVNCGPISCARAKSDLDFVPTPLNKALAESVTFSLESVRNPAYSDDIREMLDELKDDVIETSESQGGTGVPDLDMFFHYKH